MAPADSPPLSRSRLENILGLPQNASRAQLLRASIELLSRLEQRTKSITISDRDPDGQPTDGAPGAAERIRLEAEIESLLESVVYWSKPGSKPGTAPAPGRPAPAPRSRAAASPGGPGFRVPFSRQRTIAAGLVLGLALLLIGGWLASALFGSAARDLEDGTPIAEPSAPGGEIPPAVLIMLSRPQDADLRVRGADTEELLLKLSGIDATLQLKPGEYEVEVSREDCPDVWIRSIQLEPGETRRYEPSICLGAGELVVRSNVTGDRVVIDGFDVGSTRLEPHLLGVGDHEVRVSKSGYLPFEGKVRIRPDQRTELRAELETKRGQGAGTSNPTAGAAAKDAAGSQTPGPPSSPGRPASQKTAVLPFEIEPSDVPPPISAKELGRSLEGIRTAAAADLLAPGGLDGEAVPFQKSPISFGPDSVDGGSTTWHDRIRARMLSEFDADGSGEIDRDGETESIPCSFWQATERSFDEGGLGISMSRLYGFDGSEWHPDALGFAREQRGLAFERMRVCGLAK